MIPQEYYKICDRDLENRTIYNSEVHLTETIYPTVTHKKYNKAEGNGAKFTNNV